MSVVFRPHGEAMAKIHTYMPVDEVVAVSIPSKVFVMCDDGENYVAVAESYDVNADVGQLHFPNWARRYDYHGSFRNIYLGNYIEPEKPKSEKKKERPQPTSSTKLAARTRYSEDFLAKPRLSTRKSDDSPVAEPGIDVSGGAELVTEIERPSARKRVRNTLIFGTNDMVDESELEKSTSRSRKSISQPDGTDLVDSSNGTAKRSSSREASQAQGQGQASAADFLYDISSVLDIAGSVSRSSRVLEALANNAHSSHQVVELLRARRCIDLMLLNVLEDKPAKIPVLQL